MPKTNYCPRCDRAVFHAEEKCAFGRVWHLFCFSCYKCRKLLDNCEVSHFNGEIFCSVCSQKYIEDKVEQESSGKSLCTSNKSIDETVARTITQPPSSTSCLRPKSSPTAITLWYSRQHPTKYTYMEDSLNCMDVCASAVEFMRKEDGLFTQLQLNINYGPLDLDHYPTKEKMSDLDSKNRFDYSTVGHNENKLCIYDDEWYRKNSIQSDETLTTNSIEETKNRVSKRSCFGGGLECRRCGRMVYQAEMMLASGSVFHTVCFSCNFCGRPLDTRTVCENQSEIYCKQCLNKLFGPAGYGYGGGAGVLQTM